MIFQAQCLRVPEIKYFLHFSYYQLPFFPKGALALLLVRKALLLIVVGSQRDVAHIGHQAANPLIVQVAELVFDRR